MKTKNYITTFLILCFPILSFCQIIQKDIVERINKSAYIFEGEVIRSDGYWNDKKNFIYTSLTVDIKKVFKGNLLCGKVELITYGGVVGDSVELDISHNLVLNKGEKGIFLCRETGKELPLVDYYPENNYQKLETIFNEQGFIKYFNDGINPEVWDYQFSLDSLGQAYDLMELYTQIHYVDCYPNISVFSSDSISNLSLDRSVSGIYDVKCENENYQRTASNLIDTNITYTLQNPQITSANGHKYFEFDISLSDSLTGIYFYNSVAKFRYDTLTFGSRIRAHQKLVATRGVVNSDTTVYGNLSIADSQDDVAIITIPGRAQSTLPYYELTTTPSSAAHIQIEILDCGHLSSIDQVGTTLFASYTTNSNLAPPTFHYDTIYLANSISFPGCGSMYINSISPYVAKAGISDTVTITGAGFGAVRGNGNVFLKNADNGGQTYLHLDSMDFLPNGWSDSLIKFVLPSIVDTSNINVSKATPGSGFVRVKNDIGDSTSSLLDRIEIEYGVNNTSFRNPVRKYITNLVPIDATKSFSFRPDSSFYNHPDRMACLESTIKQWVCLTAVNFKLGSQYNTGDSIAVTDSICSVSFGLLDSATIANTTQWRYYRSGNCNTAYASEMDVFFNKNLVYFEDTSSTANVPNGKYDIYQVLLHEFGHAHLLTHVNDPSDVMWWQSSPYGISANNRRIKLYTDISASDGGNFVVNHSMNVDTINCPFIKMLPGTTNCTGVGISEVANFLSDFKIFPNPTTTDLHFELTFEKAQKCKFTITDIYGREVLSVSANALAGKFEETIPISELASGLYLLNISAGNYKYVDKFLKQ